MKGIELPINVLIIIVIVLIVLLAVIAFFFGTWNPGVIGVSLESAKNNACQMLISTGCGNPANIVVNGFDANKDGEINPGIGWVSGSCGTTSTYGDNLAALCECHYYLPDVDDCAEQLCRCEPII
jgi:hypothetical protein